MADPAARADGPDGPDDGAPQGAATAEPEHHLEPQLEPQLEDQLEESLRLAQAQLARIRGNLALVVGFLTRPEP